MKASIITVITLVFCVCRLSAQVHEVGVIDMSNDELLKELDILLTNKEAYAGKKKTTIDHLKHDLATAQDNEQRYWTARALYNEYRTFDSDSALYYTDVCMQYAVNAQRQKWIDEINIFRSYVYSATGLLPEAQNSINRINPDGLDRNHFLQYKEQQIFLFTHQDQYLGLSAMENPYTGESVSKVYDIIREIPSSDPQYCWFNGWYALCGGGDAGKAISQILPIVSKRRFDTLEDAKDAWVLSALYKKAGDSEKMLKFLILSAIADTKTANKEIASIEEVAEIMYGRGDLKRANDYIKYALDCANEYKSRVRVGKLADLQYKITTAYQLENEKQSDRLKTFFIALIVIVVLLLLTLGNSILQNRKLRHNKIELDNANCQLNRRIEEQNRLQQQLEEANGKLKEMYSSAKQSTVELSETNYIKERYIVDVFAICSSYISKLEDFRRDIHRLLVERKFDELSKLSRNPELSYAEIKELYHKFDTMFLRIYPDFVKDFNSLLRPEEQIVLKKGELLNTELRIYALVRLGFSDSPKIAQFLHCSVRTVYNARQRIRNKALIPKSNFAETVKSLGKVEY